MGRLKKYIKPEVLYIIVTLAIKFFATYVELWIPSLMEIMLREETVSSGTEQIWFYGGLMLLCAIVTGAFTGLCAQFLINHGGKLWKTISR